MNIFELGFILAPLVGAVVGVRYHTAFGVGPVLGGSLGALSGIAAYFAIVLALAAIMSWTTGKPFFRPKKQNENAEPDAPRNRH
jgi:hypothetical protein